MIESPYIDCPDLFATLQRRRDEGLEVSVVVPSTNHHKIYEGIHRALALKYSNILKFRNANGHMSHGKIALIDDRVVFGSANFNHALLTEIEISVVDKELALEVKKRFEWLLNN